MKKIYALLPALLLCIACLAQPSGSATEYALYRNYTTIPPYGLAKVENLIRHIQVITDDNEQGPSALLNNVYASLSVREKFTYNMIHAEDHSQNCSVIPSPSEPQKKIFGQLPDLWSEDAWSDRQMSFFKDNKDSVIALMTESIKRTGRVGLNYKHVIADINATSMIPLLIETYNLKKRDADILTVLMLLMLKAKYEPF